MKYDEPTLETIEDYSGKESEQKRLTVWIVVLSGLLVGALFAIIAANSQVSDVVVNKETTGIVKY
jgi:hypothetical protein